jgi:hypothetical protein
MRTEQHTAVHVALQGRVGGVCTPSNVIYYTEISKLFVVKSDSGRETYNPRIGRLEIHTSHPDSICGQASSTILRSAMSPSISYIPIVSRREI